ncbi:uncharacterized protein IL334_003586 [Kwoniella shivajii]|uniref:F-box domain-containing protein n=1 Tax=Kwoniella shivajii TaxID=564305 RepID=A0ABZ1D221_9TREE|nr:hypothetical protein IL334_003586 [Kwoniella shivajii]
MDSPIVDSSPPTPSSPDILPEIDRLTLNPQSNEANDKIENVRTDGEKQKEKTIEDDELEKFRAQWREEVKVKSKKNDTPSIGMNTDLTKKGKGKEKGKQLEIPPLATNSKHKGDVIKEDSEIPHTITNEDHQPISKSTSPTSPSKTNKLPSPISPKRNPPLPVIQPLRYKPGQSIDLENLDSELTSSTFTPFKPPSSSSHISGNSFKPIRYTGSIAVGPDGDKNDKERAVQLYTKAVESEQSGKLNDALLLYRKAFKLDDDVDRSYARSLKISSTSQSQAQSKQTQFGRSDIQNDLPPTPSSSDIISPTPPSVEPYSFARHIQMAPDYEKASSSTTLTSEQSPTTSTMTKPITPIDSPPISLSPLTAMFQSLIIPPNEIQFVAAEEDLPCPISNLPNELFEPILNRLDVTSIERFGSTCWRARYLTQYSNVWKRIAERIYIPPSILPLPEIFSEEDEQDQGGHVLNPTKEETMPYTVPVEVIQAKDLAKRHRNEWRTTFVEEERVRMDGCYIAVCHYIRPGAGEEWVTITHMITYHRFLRFYPDGNVISFLTTDHPSEIVPNLKPSIRGKGLHFGRWKLIRSDSIPTSPNDISSRGKRIARILVTDLTEPGIENPKYEFEMELALKSTGRGRWNKLEIIEYRSINLLTGEVLALALKHQKPFYFSKVRSYNPLL